MNALYNKWPFTKYASGRIFVEFHIYCSLEFFHDTVLESWFLLQDKERLRVAPCKDGDLQSATPFCWPGIARCRFRAGNQEGFRMVKSGLVEIPRPSFKIWDQDLTFFFFKSEPKRPQFKYLGFLQALPADGNLQAEIIQAYISQ